jgi:hypothetical protein
VVDLLDAAIGQVTAIHAFGDRHGWVDLVLEHRSGASSSATLCATTPVDPARAGVELYGPAGVLEVDCTAAVDASAFATLRRELVEAVAAGAATRSTCTVACTCSGSCTTPSSSCSPAGDR